MTYELESQIKELRAELSNAVDPDERRQIAAELDFAQAEQTRRWPSWTAASMPSHRSEGRCHNSLGRITRCRGSSIDLISSTSGMVRPGRLAAT